MAEIKNVTPEKITNTNMILKQYPRAKDLSLILCHCCGLLNSSKVNKTDAHKNQILRCVRCHSVLHERKPGSLNRTFALVVAATILYIPANVLPMTVTDSLLGRQQDTIMSGVIYFWQSGDYLVSVVIFMASIFIPMLKLLILYFLLLVVYIQSSAAWKFAPEQCIKLYRIVEFVGRWSMIDVFVVALLTALIQIQSLATILAGPGSIAFGAVVVLTMFASLSFDPRIIWDNFYASQNTNKPNRVSSEKNTIIQAEHSPLNNDSINPSQ
ncbi:paraquat-inducible protein A [Acinetobacter baumannii]|uniref:paraquat-inducible protein A n=1 Tax=Acinetobacter baumannii TaxID=470 RepID=UPI001057BD2A|nr:paraquat-inducible protein A [Acinetobacter baumannii]MCL6176340.1 paraquat-inducible protein A [Acinetobacter baumannii]MCL6178722.1 paraquat-inducible protein A [Acinetobacter baumannii]MCL6185631.1 paraquat-inducible protein A [Acinetobacter baumannii]MCL6207242.1 paraquat-inducible protein A [Acinetobacter baumannii]MCL6210196.1 paraquat-inducible protein A [Acinetobacter baumannii]